MEAILCSPPEKPAFPVDSGLIRCFHQTLHQSNFHGCPPSHGVTSCCDVLSPCTLYLPSPARKTAWVSISQIRKLRSRGVKRGTWELLPQIIRGWQVALSLGCLAFAHGQGVELLPKCWLSHRECESLVLWKEEVISCESAPAHCRAHTRHTSLLLPGPYNGHLAPVFAALICVWVLSLKFSFLCESQDCSILSVCLSACLHEGHIQKVPLFSGHLVYLTVLIPLSPFPLQSYSLMSFPIYLLPPSCLFFHSVF